MRLHAVVDFVKRGFGAGSPGNIGLVAYDRTEVANLYIGGQVLLAAAAECINKVLGVSLTAVSLVLVDPLVLLVVSAATAA